MQFVPNLSALPLLPTGAKRKKKKKSRLGGMRYLKKDSELAEKHEEAITDKAAEMYDNMTMRELQEWMKSVSYAVPGSRDDDYERQRIKEILVEWGVAEEPLSDDEIAQILHHQAHAREQRARVQHPQATPQEVPDSSIIEL